MHGIWDSRFEGSPLFFATPVGNPLVTGDYTDCTPASRIGTQDAGLVNLNPKPYTP